MGPWSSQMSWLRSSSNSDSAVEARIENLAWPGAWLTSVIQHCGRLRQVDPLRSEVRDQPDQHGKTPSLLKNTKTIRARWPAPVVPATQEAEAGEWREPGRRSLQWAEIQPLPSSLGDRARLRLKKKKGKKRENKNKETNTQTDAAPKGRQFSSN